VISDNKKMLIVDFLNFGASNAYALKWKKIAVPLGDGPQNGVSAELLRSNGFSD